jgi:ferredoxin-thioredoxin reductase catalytic subunit
MLFMIKFQEKLKPPIQRGIPESMGTNQPTTSSADLPQGDSVSSSSINEEIEKIRTWANRYAERKGLILNPDETELNTVLRGLTRNWVRFGSRYCPCRLRGGDPKGDKKIICLVLTTRMRSREGGVLSLPALLHAGPWQESGIQ